MSDARSKAEQDYAAVRDALYVLDRPATALEICTLTGLDAVTVNRRLRHAGPNTIRAEWRRFNYDPLTGRWSLTAGARQEADRAARR